VKIKIIILSFILAIATISQASVNTLNIKGKIISFDMKTVTIEIAGQNYKFNREKLGKSFVSLRKGETVEIDVEKEAANK
jgi:uncharacterized membrane protein